MRNTIPSACSDTSSSQEEARIRWQFERLEDFGDYVLLFPNPDHKNIEEDDENGISHPDALDYFDKIFTTNAPFPYKRKFMDALKEAFQYAFVELAEFVPRKQSEKKKIQQKREEDQAKKAQELKEYERAMSKIRKKNRKKYSEQAHRSQRQRQTH